MALISCAKCGRQISDKAKKCPGCGWVPGTASEETINKNPVFEKNSVNDVEINKLKREKDELQKEIQKLQLQNVQLNTCIKSGEEKMQGIITELQNENRRVISEKEQVIQKMQKIERQAPKIVDNTDYKTINIQKEEIIKLKKQIETLNSALKELKSKNINNPDYELINKLQKELEGIKKEKNELENTLKNGTIVGESITKQDMQNYIDRLVKKIIILMIIVVVSLTVIDFAVAQLTIPTEASVSGKLDKEIVTNEENNLNIPEMENDSNVSETVEEPENVKTSDDAGTTENKSYDGELIGEIVNEPDELNGVTCSYMGISSDSDSYLEMAFRITNNSGQDIIFDYEKNYYMNNNIVYVFVYEFQNEIQNGKSSTLKLTFEKKDIKMSAGNVINDFEIECKDKQTDEKFSIVFNGINIAIN